MGVGEEDSCSDLRMPPATIIPTPAEIGVVVVIPVVPIAAVPVAAAVTDAW